MSARLVSVNVGLPRDVSWHGETVHTGIWKTPRLDRVQVRRLNLDGDGQGDLGGHGGVNRPVLVYQMDSYRYWERELGRHDFSYGQFGENFTVDGLLDAEVCIGDRYRIGSAVFKWQTSHLFMASDCSIGTRAAASGVFAGLPGPLRTCPPEDDWLNV